LASLAAALVMIGRDALPADERALAVIDGDTVHSDQERYRLLGIDAAEIHRAQCDAERRLGELTKHRLQALIRSGPVEFRPDPPTERDKYGRLLVHLLVNGEDAACILIREGYARPWRGRREDWCTEISLAKPGDPQIDCTATSSIGTR
jgi:endonuclease YncB( thermonuclease family)